MYVYVSYTTFWCEFSCDSDYVIRRPHLKIYDMVIIRHHFSVQIQSWQSLCHPKTTFWKYMIWSSPSIIFQCEFSRDSHCVIWRLHFENIWYGHHLASFFNVNSVMTVIMSFEDYILKIYDIVITRHHFLMWIQSWQWSCHPKTTFWKYMIWSSPGIIFQCEFSCDSHCVIQRLHLKIYDMVNRHHFSFHRIQNKKVFQIHVKAKIQDKEAHLRWC